MHTDELSYRECAVLRAVAAGRCEISGGVGAWLAVDGLGCCDQLIGASLIRAGLIEAVPAGTQAAPARITASGLALIRGPRATSA
jgi:hypothetical protein